MCVAETTFAGQIGQLFTLKTPTLLTQQICSGLDRHIELQRSDGELYQSILQRHVQSCGLLLTTVDVSEQLVVVARTQRGAIHGERWSYRTSVLDPSQHNVDETTTDIPVAPTQVVLGEFTSDDGVHDGGSSEVNVDVDVDASVNGLVERLT